MPTPISGMPAHSNSPFCAFASPLVALPATYYGQAHNPPAQLHTGDTLVVHSGTYRIGWYPSHPIPGSEACNLGNASNCDMQAPPDNVVISGDTTTWPVIELVGGAYSGFSIQNTNNVTIEYFEITDLMPCKISFWDPLYSCPAPGTGNWGQNGIVGTDASDVTLSHLNVHDLGNEGIRIGRIHNLTMVDFAVDGNPEAGIDMDCSNGGQQPCSNSGTLHFENFRIVDNGCVRDLDGWIIECADQDDGGYGDGFGTWHTSGIYEFVNGYVYHNGSDGLDCLYCDQVGASVTFQNITAAANAGNQLKAAGTVSIFDSVIIGNCAQFWSTSPPNNQGSGPPNFQGMYGFDLSAVCRASGDALSIAVEPGLIDRIYNTTITTQSSCAIVTATEHNGDSIGSVMDIGNTIVEGAFNVDWHQYATGGGTQTVCGQYDFTPAGQSILNQPFYVWTQNIMWGVKNNQCPTGSLCVDPQLTNDSPVALDWTLLPSSPALGTGDPNLCAAAGVTECNIGGRGDLQGER